jgi:hypothetical protein
MASNPFIIQASPATSQTLIDPDSQALQRQKQYASMLMQQNQMPQGQMIGNQFVAPSWTQQLNSAISPLVGAYLMKTADTKQSDLALKQQELAQKNIADALRLSKGGEEVVFGAGEEGPTREVKQILPDNNAAVAKLLRPNATAIETSLGTKLLERQFREPNWKEITQYNKETGNTETFRYDANAADPRSTMQFLGISKPALTRAEEIRFADEGINTNTGRTNAPTNQPVATGGQTTTTTAPQPNQAQTKPATDTGNASLVKAFGYDPFKPPPPPANITSGKDIRAYRAEQAKPLTGTAADQVTGAKLYTDSLIKYNDYVNSLKPSDLLNPSVRVKLTSLHSQAKLAGKEANKLGVLNGGDERILEEVLPNFKDITVTKKNLNNLIQGQKEFGTSIIVNAYGTQQKAVPENMRKYVVVPQEKTTEAKTDAKPSATTTQRAVYKGENIIVKNGKWVYERTGKVVE